MTYRRNGIQILVILGGEVGKPDMVEALKVLVHYTVLFSLGSVAVKFVTARYLGDLSTKVGLGSCLGCQTSHSHNVRVADDICTSMSADALADPGDAPAPINSSVASDSVLH